MTDEEGERRIEGEVVPAEDAPVTTSSLVVRLLDTGRADAPSRVVSEQVLDDVQLRPGVAIPFSLVVPPGTDPSAHCEVTAHARLSGSPDLTPGDLLSTVSTPVPVSRSTAGLRVLIRRVR